MTGNAVVTALLLIAVCAGVWYYVSDRTAQAAQFKHITSLSMIDGAQPTECDYALGTYGNGSPGHLFIYQNELRVNIDLLDIPSFSGSMQAVIGTDGTRLIDPASVKAADGTANAAKVLDTVITKAPWDCIPWWFPDHAAFVIPNAMNF